MLRSHLPPDTPLKLTRVFEAETRQWKVLVQFVRENGPPVLIGSEPLEDFPSELMIAQAMLVA
ncbi:hypothetical protein [Bradyrhizobium genosp. SA-3]|uniref:hypothetical protein n=1 Tax=Bradyrhizobium genosp. SA-3 TaxID=508868 RepID=UPI00102A1276|nr:hypothetical protein [Bradyrhizobium genosp. SA-3]